MNKEYVGSSFDDFLKEENIAVEVKNEAIKRLISYNLLDEMKKQNIKILPDKAFVRLIATSVIGILICIAYNANKEDYLYGKRKKSWNCI